MKIFKIEGRGKVKEIENSKILFQEVLDRYEENGRVFMKTRWVEANTEINLGSVAKPNKEINSIKLEVPGEKSFLQNIFGGS